MIIGLVGKKRSGKDTVAGFLVEEFGFHRVAFADPMKQLVHALDPYVNSHGERVSNITGGEESLKLLYPEYRRLLQRLGTEAVRENPLFGKNFWIDMMWKSASPYDRIVISDVRFPNEAASVAARGGMIWKIERPGISDSYESHKSETELETIAYDRLITNSGTLADLLLATHRAFE